MTQDLHQQLIIERQLRQAAEAKLQRLAERMQQDPSLLSNDYFLDKIDEAFLSPIFYRLPVAVMVYNINLQLIYANEYAIANNNDRQQLMGQSDRVYASYLGFNLLQIDQRQASLQKVLSTRQNIQEEYRYINQQQQVVYIEQYWFPVLNSAGETALIISYAHDISALRQSENQLRISEKKSRDLIEYSQALIMTHTPDGTITMINPMITKALGYVANDMLGSNLKDFLPVYDQFSFEDNYLLSIKEKGEISGTFRVIHKNGHHCYISFHNYFFQEPGETPYIIAFGTEVTAKVQAEKELLIAKKVAEEAAANKQQFLANMSHEIRTPMNGIIGIASLLHRTTLDQQQKEYLHLIRESANNLLVLVNDVLDLEKIITGNLEFEHIPFNVVDKVRTSIASFRFKAKEKSIYLYLHNTIPEDTMVKGDPFRLNQILNNLLSNAIKFTARGGITVQLNMEPMAEDQLQLLFTISDTGIGIAQEHLTQIFNPYKQAKAEISRKYGGTGLGLSICKNLVEQMGGSIRVESTVNIGSTFFLSLPMEVVSAGPVQNNTTAKEATQVQIAGLRILAAEDVAINQYLIRHILQNAGASVTIVDNGQDAISALQKDTFDVVLMDIQMPIIDGIAATKTIRQMSDSAKAHVPIIALTANALKGDEEQYLAAGMNDYLPKPFKELDLLGVLQRVLQQPQPRQQKWLNKAWILTATDNDHQLVLQVLQQAKNNLYELLHNAPAVMSSAQVESLKDVVIGLGITQLLPDIAAFEVAYPSGSLSSEQNKNTFIQTDALKAVLQEIEMWQHELSSLYKV